MARSELIFKTHFCGNEISGYGRRYGFVDYAALAASFQHVLCNDILPAYADEAEIENGDLWTYDENGDVVDPVEVYQWFIVSDNGADILKEYTNEIVFYIPGLNLYVWGVTHFGTSWDYVLTDIPCEKEGQTE